MTILRFIEIIQEKTGINENTIGRLSYTHAIKKCMGKHGIEDPLEYLNLVENSPDEIDKLIEEIIVPETWFFREENAFKALLTEMDNQKQNGAFFPKRILSLPSSTGEEAYSIAIKLFEYGYSPSMFSIDAMDISQRNIDSAKKGTYRPNSFRNNVPEHIISKYFSEHNGSYEISNKIKHAVNFTCANLFDYRTLAKEKHYDAIFCRNLFIYFDTDTKDIAFKKISQSLKDNGLLLIGHAESSIIPRQYYQPCTTEHAFGFIKRKIRKSTTLKGRATKKIIRPAYSKIRNAISRPYKKKSPDKTAIQTHPDDNFDHQDYQAASELADKGELNKALKLTLLLCNKTKSADNYSLLGIIYSAQNQSADAEQAFRKALYLDPDHYEALIHLSLLLDKKGETHTSSLLKKRVVKTKSKTKEHYDE